MANRRPHANSSYIAVHRRSFVGWLLLLPLTACGEQKVPPIEFHIASDGDEMAFKPNHLFCRKGADVRLFFHNGGDILDDPHNWVLLKPGTEAAFLADADKSTSDTASIPPNDRDMVIAATPSCPKGHTVMVEFIAPPPGNYPFVCSFPGHGETMRGTLIVSN